MASLMRTRTSFWQQWWQGFIVLGRVYWALLALSGFWFLARGAFALTDRLPAPLTVGLDVGIVAVILLLAPPVLPALLPTREQVLAEQDERLRPLVEELARQVGIDWHQHWIGQVDALVHADKTAEASRRYREELGVSWDEAHLAIGAWKSTACEQRLRAILGHLRGTPAAPSGSTEGTAT